MGLLLDTPIFLWALIDSKRLKAEARAAIGAAEAVYVSAASVWEIAIKARIGKIEADPAEVEAAIVPSGFRELPVRARHAARVAMLPLHHTDPFDRLLIAQALVEGFEMLTADSALAPYDTRIRVV